MLISTGLDTDGSIDETIAKATALQDQGFRSMWASQIFGPDTLTVLAVVGRELPMLNLGTAVIPIQPRHPAMLAAQARTVQDSIGGTLSLGIGLSHQVVVEGLWGLSFDRPAHHMREYLEVLAPMLRGEAVHQRGTKVTAITQGAVGPKSVQAPSLLVAALGPVMLKSAGQLTDGTCLWMTGQKTIATHVTPILTAAASEAGRPAPRIVCALPVAVTNDIAGARDRINEQLALYGTLPSYKAMLDKEGVSGPAGVSLIGSKEQVTHLIGELGEAGVTEFSGAATGNTAEREATLELLASLVTA